MHIVLDRNGIARIVAALGQRLTVINSKWWTVGDETAFVFGLLLLTFSYIIIKLKED